MAMVHVWNIRFSLYNYKMVRTSAKQIQHIDRLSRLHPSLLSSATPGHLLIQLFPINRESITLDTKIFRPSDFDVPPRAEL